MTEKELLDLKNRIDRSKNQLAVLAGQKKQLLSQLQDNFNCDSTEAAEIELKKKELAIDRLSKQITTKMEEIEQQLSED